MYVCLAPIRTCSHHLIRENVMSPTYRTGTSPPAVPISLVPRAGAAHFFLRLGVSFLYRWVIIMLQSRLLF